MSENPPPPPEEGPSPDSRFDPRRRSMFPPSTPRANEPVGCAGRVALILLGIVSFVLSLGIMVSVLATGQPAIGVGVAAAALIALFVIRRRSGPSPVLGAVTVGVAVAAVVFGGCMLILLTTKLDFK